jgi:hypothetical protein
MKKCLFNTYSNNVVAYCHYHKCYITKGQMDCKHCRQKKCSHFEKKEHPYWHQQEVMKQKRKNRKQAINEYVSQFV